MGVLLNPSCLAINLKLIDRTFAGVLSFVREAKRRPYVLEANMDDKLRAGYPTSTMLVFAAVWLAVVGYAAFNGEAARKAPLQAAETASNVAKPIVAHVEQENVTDISSSSREEGPDNTGAMELRSYMDQHNRALLE
jgi:hypothetical protein